MNRLSISELCFDVENIDEFTQKLTTEGVEFMSKPQYFDLTDQGFGCSKTIYLRDPDGNYKRHNHQNASFKQYGYGATIVSIK